MATSGTDSESNRQSLPLIGLVHLSVIYLVWGSTYLAIRVAVREGSGFPPFTMAALRTLLGGGILLLITGLRGRRLRLTRSELAVLVPSGLLLWVGGNGLVTWAETRADSGYAALLIATIPLWIAAIEAILDRRTPSALLIVSLLVGLAGIALLSWPQISGGDARDVAAFIALLLAPVFWSLGTVLQRRRPVGVSPRVSAGYQQVFGAAGFILTALLLGEPTPTPTGEAVAAWLYLVVLGSVVAFSSYVAAVQILPTRVVATYAYVNPVIAVVLGALVLDEPITGLTLGGMALVLLAVTGVFRASTRPAPRA